MQETTKSDVDDKILRELRAIRLLLVVPCCMFVGRLIGQFVGENAHAIGAILYEIVSP